MGRASYRCHECSIVVDGPDLDAFCEAYLAHTRVHHADWPFPDVAIRNFAAATQRLTGSTERLPAIGPVAVHPVSAGRIPDWLDFFDHDAFAGNPVDACCYCAGPHMALGRMEQRPWRENRALMVRLLESGRAYGYLAYVAGKPAGWVNASLRSACATYRLGAAADPPDGAVIALSCFGIAPPYRGHGLVAQLLQRVVTDAPSRGAHWVEAYPLRDQSGLDEDNWLGQAALLARHGFEVVDTMEHQTVMRLRVDPG